jgi:hypothetical protein
MMGKTYIFLQSIYRMRTVTEEENGEAIMM